MKIVCIHGLAGSHKYFTRLESELKSLGFEVLSFDLPGFGDLKNIDSNFSVESYLKFLDEKLKDETDLILLGHSAGGLLALKWSSLNQSRVRKIILLNIPFAENLKEIKDGLAMQKLSWSFLLEFHPQFSKFACNILCQKGYMKYFHFLKPKFITEEIFADYTKHTFVSISSALESLLLKIFAKPLLKALVQKPVLVLSGNKEPNIFHLNSSLNNIVEKQIFGGHHILHESFEETEQEILQFLQSN